MKLVVSYAKCNCWGAIINNKVCFYVYILNRPITSFVAFEKLFRNRITHRNKRAKNFLFELTVRLCFCCSERWVREQKMNRVTHAGQLHRYPTPRPFVSLLGRHYLVHCHISTKLVHELWNPRRPKIATLQSPLN